MVLIYFLWWVQEEFVIRIIWKKNETPHGFQNSKIQIGILLSQPQLNNLKGFYVRVISIENRIFVMKSVKLSDINLLFRMGSERSLHFRQFLKIGHPLGFQISEFDLGIFCLFFKPLLWGISPNCRLFLVTPPLSIFCNDYEANWNRRMDRQCDRRTEPRIESGWRSD